MITTRRKYSEEKKAEIVKLSADASLSLVDLSTRLEVPKHIVAYYRAKNKGPSTGGAATSGVRSRQRYSEKVKAAALAAYATQTAAVVAKKFKLSNPAIISMWASRARKAEQKDISITDLTSIAKPEPSPKNTAKRSYVRRGLPTKDSVSPDAVHYCPHCGTDMLAVAVALSALKQTVE